MSDLQRAIDDITENASFYVKAASYLNGDVAEKFANPRYSRLLEGSANRFRTNYARVPVVAVVARVQLSALGAENDEPASQFLETIWRDNGLENMYREVHTLAASAGSAYLIAWPDPDDETGNTIDISICDPQNTRVFYSTENPRKALFAARMWAEGKRTRVNLYYTDRIEKYISNPGAQGKNAKTYSPYIELEDLEGNAVWPVENPFGVIPVFHFRVSTGYGRPVNRDAWEPQDAINKLTATLMASVDFQGFPQRYILQKPGAPIENDGADEWDDDTINTDPSAITDTDDNPSKSLKAGPGGLWFLQADTVGQFEAADPKVFLEPLQQYIKAISTTTQTPLHAFHGMGDAPSGESLRAANAPLTDSARNLQGWFEPTWLDIFDFILLIGGFENADAFLTWAPSDSNDDQDYWDAVTTKIGAGVPKEVALEEAGYTPEQQAAWDPEPEVPATTVIIGEPGPEILGTPPEVTP